MTEATEHALEQAERIVQYAKYSDRFMVVEGDSAAERRAFVKLIGQKLPRQVRPVVLRADSGNGSAALIDQLSTLLQLSAGIETIEQLIGATTAALDGQERLLIVVENADQWLTSDTADTLFDLITQSHELARERILFLLVGASGLCEQAETAQPLAGLVADLHCAQLLGATQQATTAPASTSASAKGSPGHPTEYASAAGATATPSSAAARAGEDTPRSTATSRPLWASPTLVIAAVISIAVVAIGVFALLGRSETPPPESSVAMSESDQQSDQQTGKPTANETAADEEQASDSEASDQQASDKQANAADAAPTEEADGSPDESAALVEHGVPPHVPFPEEDGAATTDDSPAETDTSESSDDRSVSAPASETGEAEKDETTVAPVTEDARGAAAATPPTDVDNNWFRDQPRARAAIQMAAFGKLEGAEAMIDRYATDEQPRDQWRIYTQSVNGQLLYTVTFGDFASAERAEHAIDSLPASLRGLEPYPRTVGAIQDRLVDASD
ncbi:MAG: SPOR domain-containing protein [Guyparkeria sp.]